MNLEKDLHRWALLLAGRLLSIDGPLQDRSGIFYRCGERLFRSHDAARRYRDRHNRTVRTAVSACVKGDRRE